MRKTQIPPPTTTPPKALSGKLMNIDWHPEEILLLKTELLKEQSPLNHKKLSVLYRLSQGKDAQEVSRELLVNEQKIADWLFLYQEEGLLCLLSESERAQSVSRTLLHDPDQELLCQEWSLKAKRLDQAMTALSQTLRERISDLEQLRQEAAQCPLEPAQAKKALNPLLLELKTQESLLKLQEEELSRLLALLGLS